MYILGIGSCLSDNFYMHVQVQKHLHQAYFTGETENRNMFPCLEATVAEGRLFEVENAYILMGLWIFQDDPALMSYSFY